MTITAGIMLVAVHHLLSHFEYLSKLNID